jgi:hypothetical protein
MARIHSNIVSELPPFSGESMRFLIIPFALALALPALAAGPTGLLNDTGQTGCYDASDAAVACDSAGVGGDGGVNPRQDARFGRDAKAAAGTLTKVGGGAAGFDFSKMCWNGDTEGGGTCTGTLLANTTSVASGTPSTDWACTKDNVTNLIWSLESGSGDWTYATTTYPAAMNTAGRCGFTTGWRAPTRRELMSIVHHGADTWYDPVIEVNYFPNTYSDFYWTSNVYVDDTANAWDISFLYGDTSYSSSKSNIEYVRLVRSGS